eukprot:76297-Chlamydomonas_euryale.AAC.5
MVCSNSTAASPSAATTRSTRAFSTGMRFRCVVCHHDWDAYSIQTVDSVAIRPSQLNRRLKNAAAHSAATHLEELREKLPVRLFAFV